MRNKPAYRQKELPVRERVKDLVSRMNLEQKVAQLNCVMLGGGVLPPKEELQNGIGQVSALFAGMTAADNAKSIRELQRILTEETELGIPALIHAEALSGAVLAEATNFPVAIGLAATWDSEKAEQMASVIAEQMRTVGVNQAFAPVLDVARDLRWGRVGETCGECPALTAKMGTAYVRGLQGKDLENGVAATSKHFLGFAMGQGGYNLASASITPRELREVYAKPFEAAIRNAGLAAVMNTYSAIDNEPVVGSKKYLTDLLRGELGFRGITVTDYASLSRLKDVFHVAEDYTEAGIMAFNAGMDQELPSPVGYGPAFAEAVRDGRVEEVYLDMVVSRILELKFRLGLFEDPYPREEDIAKYYHQPAHDALSYQLARESVVLLKNEGNILPLQKRPGRIAVIGPNADDLRNVFGGYTYVAFTEMCLEAAKQQMSAAAMEGVDTGDMQQAASALPDFQTILPYLHPQAETILAGIREKCPDVVYAKGCDVLDDDKSGFAGAVTAAESADIVIMVVGGKNGSGCNCSVGENIDSSDIGLPGIQEDLVREVYGTGKPMIVVHMDARPLCSPWIIEHAPAILEAWYPGQCGSAAVADILFGDAVPGGKLPFTIIRNAGQIPVFAEYRYGNGYNDRRGMDGAMDPEAVRSQQGYVNESGKPLYPFGYGISYTHSVLSGLKLSAGRIPADGSVEISCRIRNTGSMAADEVVQLYISDRYASMIRPNKELAGFQRVCLKPGEEKEITFLLQADQSAFLNGDMQWMVEAGDMDFFIGLSSEDRALEGSFRIENTRILASGARAFYAESAVSDN